MTRANRVVVTDLALLAIAICVGCANKQTSTGAGSGGQGASSPAGAAAGAAAGSGSSGTSAPSSSGAGGSQSATGGSRATGGSGTAQAGASAASGSSAGGAGGDTAGQGASAGAGAGGQGAAGAAQAGGTGAAGTAGTAGANGNLPPTGSFPAVQDLTAMGPYTAQTIENTGPDGQYTLYRPKELAPNGVLNPIVSWGNGALTVPSWYSMLPHLASHGFVVIASDSSSVTADLVKAGIDWVVQQNETMSSELYHKLDTKNVAGVGYSLGGLATYGVADDPRLVTVVIISGANMSDRSPVAKLHTPTAFFCTDDDASRGNCDGDFAVITVPSFYGVMKGSQHVDVALDPATQTKLSKPLTGWLRWQQMADQTQQALFVGSMCGLCQDSAWAVQQKNGLM
jgi:hypothetical protein